MKNLFLILILLLPSIVIGNSLPPQPLRSLVEEADLVVVAKVLRLDKSSEWGNKVATLEIEKVLNGSLDQKMIKVSTNHDLICPSPAKFRVDSTVLAFLDRGEEGENLQPHGLAYGVKYLSREGIQIYEERIKEILDINSLPEGDTKNIRLVDWFLECMRSPATNWEGAYELSHQNDRNTGKKDRIYRLPLRQTLDLRKILFSRKELLPIEVELIDLIKNEDDPELVGFLTHQINESDTFNRVLSERLMPPIAELSGRSDLMDIQHEYFTYDPSDRDKDYDRILQKFIAVLNYEIRYPEDGDLKELEQERLRYSELSKSGSTSQWPMVFAIGLSLILLGGGVWYLRKS